MTTIGAINATAGNGVIGNAAESALGGMGGESFLQLLVAQLRYQNPMEPSDPSDMMLQTAQLTQLENVQQMVELQRRDLGLQEAVMAAGLVGSEVSASPSGEAADLVTGTVESVRFTADGPVLNLGSTEVALGDVSVIRGGAAAPAPA